MTTLSYTSRRQAVEQSFPVAVIVLAPLLAIFVQAYGTRIVPRLDIIDLPLIVVIYAALSRRNPAIGALAGTAIGIAQDALTSLPLGIYGIAKTIVGYAAASISMRVDVENMGARLLLVFVFTLVHDAAVYSIERFLLNMAHSFLPVHELIRAVLNSVVALAVFALLDLFRRRA